MAFKETLSWSRNPENILRNQNSERVSTQNISLTLGIATTEWKIKWLCLHRPCTDMGPGQPLSGVTWQNPTLLLTNQLAKAACQNNSRAISLCAKSYRIERSHRDKRWTLPNERINRQICLNNDNPSLVMPMWRNREAGLGTGFDHACQGKRVIPIELVLIGIREI